MPPLAVETLRNQTCLNISPGCGAINQFNVLVFDFLDNLTLILLFLASFHNALEAYITTFVYTFKCVSWHHVLMVERAGLCINPKSQ
jgi:hypothetical protein